MSNNWVVQSLEGALSVWNEKQAEIWEILCTDPEQFHGGALWQTVTDIHGALQAIAYGLLVLFFAAGVLKTCGSAAELRRPETGVRLLVRFVLAKAVISYGLEGMSALLSVVQGIVRTIYESSGQGGSASFSLPEAISTAASECSFLESIPLWAVALIGSLLIWVLAVTMILTVYGRFFQLYLYTAIAPIPLSAFAGEPTRSVGIAFLKSYAAVCLKGAVILLACVLFSAFSLSAPDVDTALAPAAMVWQYVAETAFHMLLLVGTVRMADRVVRDLFGL